MVVRKIRVQAISGVRGFLAVGSTLALFAACSSAGTHGSGGSSGGFGASAGFGFGGAGLSGYGGGAAGALPSGGFGAGGVGAGGIGGIGGGGIGGIAAGGIGGTGAGGIGGISAGGIGGISAGGIGGISAGGIGGVGAGGVGAGGVGAGGVGAGGVGAGGVGAGGGSPVPAGSPPTSLPTAKGTCAPLTNGTNNITVNSTAMTWTIWVGSKAASPTGPIVIYWHGTGTSGQEATWGLGNAAITEIQSEGGLVAAAETTSNTGTNTGDGVWYTGDLDYSDQIIACALQQLNIDTRRIYGGGYSAGALQIGYMYGARSYLAAVVVYSGGSFLPAFPMGYIPPVLGAHGSTSGDFLAGTTTTWEMDVKNQGGFVIDCDDGGAHTDITRLINLGPSTWEFFKDHPYAVGKPDPYAGGLPSNFLSICKIQ